MGKPHGAKTVCSFSSTATSMKSRLMSGTSFRIVIDVSQTNQSARKLLACMSVDIDIIYIRISSYRGGCAPDFRKSSLTYIRSSMWMFTPSYAKKPMSGTQLKFLSALQKSTSSSTMDGRVIENTDSRTVVQNMKYSACSRTVNFTCYVLHIYTLVFF